MKHPDLAPKAKNKIVSFYMENPNITISEISNMLMISERQCHKAISDHLHKLTRNPKNKRKKPANKPGLFKVPKSTNENDYSSFNGIRNIKWTMKTFGLTSNEISVGDVTNSNKSSIFNADNR